MAACDNGVPNITVLLAAHLLMQKGDGGLQGVRAMLGGGIAAKAVFLTGKKHKFDMGMQCLNMLRQSRALRPGNDLVGIAMQQ